MATQLWSVLLIVFSTVLSATASFLLKLASKKLSLRIKSLITNLPLLGSVALYGISTIIAIIAYRGGELTILVPFGSLNYIWAALLAMQFLDEKMNRWKWLGISTIIIGITFISLGALW